MKKTIMKVMALLLAVVLMLPSSLVFAATESLQADKQIGEEGGKKKDINADPIEISKRIYPTEIENYLDLELIVKTKEEVSKIYESTAIVLVLDASNTMSEKIGGKDENETRVEKASAAVSNFINQYYTNVNGAKRELAIVSFDTNAKTRAELGDYSNNVGTLTGNGGVLDQIKEVIAGNKGTHKRFTNIEAGLLLARNILKDSEAMHKYIILATDGFPTTYAVREANHSHTGGGDYSISHIKDNGSKTEISGYCPYMEPDSSTPHTGSCVTCGENAVAGEPGYFSNELIHNAKAPYYCTGCDAKDESFADGKYHVHNAKDTIECKYGTSYSDWAAWAAENMAKIIKDEGINIFSIGIDIGGQSIRGYMDAEMHWDDDSGEQLEDGDPDDDKKPSANSGFSVLDFPVNFRGNYEPIIGMTSEDYANWLGGNTSEGTGIGGSKLKPNESYYTSDNNGDFSEVFNTINTYINEIKEISSKAKWLVTDPIPSPFNLVAVYNNGTLTQTDIPKGAYILMTENGAELTWDLKVADCTSEKVGNETRYTYTLKYRIRVGTEMEGFVSNQFKYTNGDASFTWDKWDGEKWVQQEPEVFPKPSAKGYLGSLEFTKVDSEDNGLEDAVFTLKHSVNCSVCKAANNGVYIGDMTATSDSDGKVSFTKIPSGHDYVLSETVPPNGYQYDDKSAGVRNTYSVKVAYGETTVSGMTDNKVLNKKIEPAEVVFNVTKTRDENAPEDYSFKFGIFDENDNILKDANGNDYIVTVDKDNNPASFDPIIYDKWEDEFVTNGYKTDGTKTYYYKIKEIPSTGAIDNGEYTYDDDYIYDETVYEASVTVGVNDTRTQYTADPEITGNASDTDVSFYNEYLDPTEVQFTATKTLEGTENIPDGIFSFTLIGEGISETVQNVGNTVTFSKITYDKLGTHNYEIREVIGDNLSILYDRTVYDVEVVVKHNDNKTAYDTVVTIKDGNETVNGIAFENTLREPVDVILEARKTVNNEKPGYYQFEFELKDADGKVVSTVKNDSEGKIVFDKLTFDKAGTYNYTMSEKRFFAIGMLFDMKVYDVEIVVTADSTDDDPFEATVTVSRKGKVLEDWPVFRNITNGRSEENEDYNPSTGATVITAASVAAVTAGGIVLVKFIRNKKRK